MTHVFVSYLDEDHATVNRLCDGLKKKGVKIWIDREMINPGENWRQAIRAAIQDGSRFIACFSKNYSGKSTSYMEEELDLASELMESNAVGRDWFLPILLNGNELPIRAIAGECVSGLQFVRMEGDWETGLAKISKALPKAHSRPAEGKRILVNFGRIPPGEDEDTARAVAYAFGEKLSRTGFTFIYAGTRLAPAATAARAFLESSRDEATERLTTFLPRMPFRAQPQQGQPDEDSLYEKCGRTLILDDWPWQRRERMVKECDVMTMVGGFMGSGHVAQLAREFGKFILPVPRFRGFAEKEYKRVFDQATESNDLELRRWLLEVADETLPAESLAQKMVNFAIWLAEKRSSKGRILVATQPGAAGDGLLNVVRSVGDLYLENWDVAISTAGSHEKQMEALSASSCLIADLDRFHPELFLLIGAASALGLPILTVSRQTEGPTWRLPGTRIEWRQESELRRKMGRWFVEVSV